jgi:ATP-dependent Clp protease ATP-binding subunit ClpC
MDNNFSAQVKEIISYSREEALRLGNDFIGTEHLVLGLIRDGENTAIKILKSLNVDLYELRKEIEVAVKDKTGKNISKAALALGISRRTLHRKLAQSPKKGKIPR